MYMYSVSINDTVEEEECMLFEPSMFKHRNSLPGADDAEQHCIACGDVLTSMLR